MIQSVDPFNHNCQLGRGVNIIGYDPIWKSRTEGRMQGKHFRMLKEAGFNHVRINLHPFKFMGNGPEYVVHSSWFETLDWVMEQCQENGLLAILDMHEFYLIGQEPAKYKDAFIAFWKQLASHCKNAPESVLFEILNEPNTNLTAVLWNEYCKEALEIIRATNPTRTVIIGPVFWNGIEYLDELELPEKDRNIIVTVHYYHPMPFTHQGAPWNDENRDFSGITWSGRPEETELIQQEFAGVQRWAKKHNRPIYLGEFGAYDKADMNSRACYTNAVAREAERLGWSWGYWQFDSDFIVYDINKDCWVEPIRDALIPK